MLKELLLALLVAAQLATLSATEFLPSSSKAIATDVTETGLTGQTETETGISKTSAVQIYSPQINLRRQPFISKSNSRLEHLNLQSPNFTNFESIVFRRNVAQRRLPSRYNSMYTEYCKKIIDQATSKVSQTEVDTAKIPMGCLPYWILKHPSDLSKCSCTIDEMTFVPDPVMTPTSTTETGTKICSASNCETGSMKPSDLSSKCVCTFEDGMSTFSPMSIITTCNCLATCNLPHQSNQNSLSSINSHSKYLCAFTAKVDRAIATTGMTRPEVGCNCFMKISDNSKVPSFRCDCYNK